MASKLKFASERELGRDDLVPLLEGLWRRANLNAFTAAGVEPRRDGAMMLMYPGWIDEAMVHAAVAFVRTKGSVERIDNVRVE